MSEQTTGSPDAMASSTGMPKPSNPDGKTNASALLNSDRMTSRRCQPTQVYAGSPVLSLQEPVDSLPGLARQAGHDQVLLPTFASKLPVGFKKANKVLVRMNRGNGQQVPTLGNARLPEPCSAVGRVVAKVEEAGFHTVQHHPHFVVAHAVDRKYIVS